MTFRGSSNPNHSVIPKSQRDIDTGTDQTIPKTCKVDYVKLKPHNFDRIDIKIRGE